MFCQTAFKLVFNRHIVIVYLRDGLSNESKTKSSPCETAWIANICFHDERLYI